MKKMRTIIEIDLIVKRANERIIKEFTEFGFSNPPVVSHGVVRAVLEAAEQSAEKLNLFSACANCEYNPCDLRNNLDYCPAQERRIKNRFNPAIISG